MFKNRLRFLSFIFALLFPLLLWGQGTYYNGIDTGTVTFVADLQNLVSQHTQISYDNFDETNIAFFASRDTTGGQKAVTCVYSGQIYVYTPPFTWIPFSREHTWCHSWMPTHPSTSGKEYTDQHHLFPTNHNNVNGVRSNHPLGIVVTPSGANGTYLEARYGTNSSGQTVYEPRNAHKGDAARALFYMALRYNWTFDFLNNTRLPALSEAPQSVDLLIQWHTQDPPDDWERARNEYIHSIQNNRNPFVDHPEYVNVIDFNTLTKKTSASPPPPSSGNYISITSSNFSYTENFDGLSNSGTSIPWSDNTTIPGWYSNKETYDASTGTAISGSAYSFGSSAAIDRSFGSIGSNSAGSIQYAVRFINSTGSTITTIPLRYTGEQWRNGGNTAVQSLTFEYKINATSINDGSGWVTVSMLDFASPVASASAAPLDGNNSANKTTISSTISLSLLNGDEIWFRWTDINDAGNDHGLSIDDFSFNPNGIALPVELTSFTASIINNAIQLQWRTATEVNNHGFEVEKKRMKDELGIMNWEKIGFVEGHGTTNAPQSYTFIDRSVRGAAAYRLKQIDRDGSFEYGNIVEVTAPAPEIFSLEQNYPNPFNPVTTIEYTIPNTAAVHDVSLCVYDVLGRVAALLINEPKSPGTYAVQFDGSPLSSGIYYYVLRAGTFHAVRKLSLLK
jgi:hypothetical protein